MAQLNPYLTLPGKCRQAMTFYKECLGGELFMQAVKETPMAAQFPPHMQEQLIHSSLVTPKGGVIMASDMSRPDFVPGNTINISVNCDSEEEISTLFKKFSEGGTVIDPLKQQFWGAIFGGVVDKYGVQWLLNYSKQHS
jgi:PhnB protein